MKLYCDGSTTQICYQYEDCQPVILDLPRKVTSNTAEYLAIVAGLESAIRMRRKDLVVLSDSQLIIRQLNGEYKIKKKHLQKLASQVHWLAQKLDKVEFKWIKRDKNLAGIALENVT